MPSIIIQTNEFPPVSGGVGSYCQGFALALSRKGVDVQVVAARKTKHDDQYDTSLPYSVCRTYQKLPLIRHISRFRMLMKCLNRNQQAILWAAEWRSGIVTALVSTLFRRRMVITIHGTELLELETSRAMRLFALPVYRRAWKIIAISDYVAQLIGEKYPHFSEKTVTIKNGINPDQFTAVAKVKVDELIEKNNLSGKRIILSLCRLVPRKGVDQTIIAFSKLREEISDVILVVAGTGPEEAALRELAERLGVEDYVLFTGYVPDEEIALWYHAASLYIMLSRKDDFYVEGFGLTFLEANACGKPVVGGHHGGVPEAVIDGKTGFLVDPENPDEAAAAMTRILSDPELYRNMSELGLDFVHGRGSWGRASDEMIDLLKTYMI